MRAHIHTHPTKFLSSSSHYHVSLDTNGFMFISGDYKTEGNAKHELEML